MECVFGTHVRIKASGNGKNHQYYNRKGLYSTNVKLESILIRFTEKVFVFLKKYRPNAYIFP